MEEKVRVKRPHRLNMEDRKRIDFTGITDVVSFDPVKVVLESDYGHITIKGEETAGEPEESAAVETEPVTEAATEPVSEAMAETETQMTAAALPQVPDTTQYPTYYVVNCEEWISLRSEPRTSAAVLKEIPYGSPVSYVETAFLNCFFYFRFIRRVFIFDFLKYKCGRNHNCNCNNNPAYNEKRHHCFFRRPGTAVVPVPIVSSLTASSR